MIYTHTTNFVIESCCNCGVEFGIPKDLYDRLKRTHESFYCPNGHGQHYTGRSKEEILREENNWLKASKTHLQSQLAETKSSRNAFKGHLTRTKNRISKGVCPCCNRTFKNLGSHMSNKHPNYVEK